MSRSCCSVWLATAVLSALTVLGCGGGGNQTESSGAAPAAPIVNPVDPATAGNVTGTITFEGTPPPREPIRMNADPNCLKTSDGATSDTVVVGSGGALQNVFVYVKDGLGDRKFPVPSTPVVLDQKGCQYHPHVFGVQVGQPIQIVNSDPTLHNVHASPSANQEFNTGQPIQGMKFSRTFSTKEVMVPFKCDVHGWMHAFAGVLDHPFFAVTGPDGTFALQGLPPGTYTIEAWHEKLGTQTQTVTVGEQETKNAAFTFKSGS